MTIFLLLGAINVSMSNMDLSNLPSWILVILIGLAISWFTGRGILTQYEGLGSLMVAVGLALGVFYFATDISNKI